MQNSMIYQFFLLIECTSLNVANENLITHQRAKYFLEEFPGIASNAGWRIEESYALEENK